MKNFDWTSFTRRIAVKSTMEEMYNAWAKATEIEKWFLKNADYFETGLKADKNKNISAGMEYEWSWHLYEPVESGKITAANGKDHIQFTFAGECLVDVNLSMVHDHVVVELTQKNIPTDDESKVSYRLGCDNGWSFYLVNLKSVYEGGIDLRNKNPEFRKVVNH